MNMNSAKSNDVLTLILDIARVESGGNTGDGMYFYTFSPSITTVARPNTTLVIALSEFTVAEFRIRDIFTTDSKFQLSQPEMAADGRSLRMLDANSQKELILLSVLVEDTKNGVSVNCDPQIINRPES